MRQFLQWLTGRGGEDCGKAFYRCCARKTAGGGNLPDFVEEVRVLAREGTSHERYTYASQVW